MALLLCYVVLLGLISLLVDVVAERNILGFVCLYAPHIVWILPLVLVAILNRFKSRPMKLFDFCCLLISLFVAFHLMDFRLHVGSSKFLDKSKSTLLRFMTYNVAGGKLSPAVFKIIDDEQPNLILFQESTPDFLRKFKLNFPKWRVFDSNDLALASLYDISEFERIELPVVSIDSWKRPACVRAVVTIKGARFAVYNAHLSTPRSALNSIRNFENGFYNIVNQNLRDRTIQGLALAEIVFKEQLPFVLGGDFNAPVKSMVLTPLFAGGLRNAFNERGFGFGYTKGHDLRLGFSFVRIDHIFFSDGWMPESAHVGGVTGSDHRPLLSDIYLSN